ncbi:hypothetical protein RRG08_037810 [Elysia crispata]|uniref:Uncharacterized protein n=1 Tax=Elysia crispata TaxID=231223 RepID=A0AAE1BC72_9GAST|nr:hypothetical protein RRG08_037810 [Elysia crispata]
MEERIILLSCGACRVLEPLSGLALYMYDTRTGETELLSGHTDWGATRENESPAPGSTHGVTENLHQGPRC